MIAPERVRRGRMLIARLDSMGDLLLTGGAVRAVARSAAEVIMLVGPQQTATARLLPGVDRSIEFAAPWIVADPRPLQAPMIETLVRRLRRESFDGALILTSFHQSPLPLALLLRMAGISWVGAISEDYPGSLLDIRLVITDDLPEAERNLAVAEAAGFPADARGARLAVRRPLPDPRLLTGAGAYVVFHPGASVSARRPSAEHAKQLVEGLVGAGFRVVVTGSKGEAALTAYVAGGNALNLGGRADLPTLAAVLDRADCVVAPNTGPAHLAAAVGTPVVSLFAPTVPASRWQPYGVPTVLLGDQYAACRDSRARHCPVPGHPCLTSITPESVVAAVSELTTADKSPEQAIAFDAELSGPR